MGYRPSGGQSQAVFGPALVNFVMIVARIAFLAAVSAGLYLLYGLFFGGLAQFEQLPRPAQQQVESNVRLASNIFSGSFAIGAICAVFLFWFEELTGYLLLILAATFTYGLPLAVGYFGEGQTSRASGLAVGAFAQASVIPAAAGAIHVIKDLVTRVVGLVRGREHDPHSFEYGRGAESDRPTRMSLLGKCWEGPYCREYIRPHCPIYIARQACWKQRRGCYCEEDIVANASHKIQGIVLEMAPSEQYNFANAPTAGGPRRGALTNAQKAERCRNCIIYNEHQREKYRVLLPVTLLAGAGACYLLSGVMRHFIGLGLTRVDAIIGKLSFLPGQDPSRYIRLNEGAEWALVVAISVIVISKVLQMVEWAVFVKKI